ncbi:hypothetical protein HK101_000809 [Irineochytrium annulatum]|nr:hypothetical protein HK101_000809 [Irineochytrium annulatum]
MAICHRLQGFVRIQFGQANFRIVLRDLECAHAAMAIVSHSFPSAIYARKEPEQKLIRETGEPSRVIWASTLYWSESELRRYLDTLPGFERVSFDGGHSWIHFRDVESARAALENFNMTTNVFSVFSKKGHGGPHLAGALGQHPAGRLSPQLPGGMYMPSGNGSNNPMMMMMPMPNGSAGLVGPNWALGHGGYGAPSPPPAMSRSHHNNGSASSAASGTSSRGGLRKANSYGAGFGVPGVPMQGGPGSVNGALREVITNGGVRVGVSSGAEHFPTRAMSNKINGGHPKPISNVLLVRNTAFTDEAQLRALLSGVDGFHDLRLVMKPGAPLQLFLLFQNVTHAKAVYDGYDVRDQLGGGYGSVSCVFRMQGEVPVEWEESLITMVEDGPAPMGSTSHHHQHPAQSFTTSLDLWARTPSNASTTSTATTMSSIWSASGQYHGHHPPQSADPWASPVAPIDRTPSNASATNVAATSGGWNPAGSAAAAATHPTVRRASSMMMMSGSSRKASSSSLASAPGDWQSPDAVAAQQQAQQQQQQHQQHQQHQQQQPRRTPSSSSATSFNPNVASFVPSWASPTSGPAPTGAEQRTAIVATPEPVPEVDEDTDADLGDGIPSDPFAFAPKPVEDGSLSVVIPQGADEGRRGSADDHLWGSSSQVSAPLSGVLKEGAVDDWGVPEAVKEEVDEKAKGEEVPRSVEASTEVVEKEVDCAAEEEVEKKKGDKASDVAEHPSEEQSADVIVTEEAQAVEEAPAPEIAPAAGVDTYDVDPVPEAVPELTPHERRVRSAEGELEQLVERMSKLEVGIDRMKRGGNEGENKGKLESLVGLMDKVRGMCDGLTRELERLRAEVKEE